MYDNNGYANSVRRTLRVLISIIIAIGSIWLMPANIGKLGSLQRAAAASDPVIAAAGDIACDPASTSFNGGLGTSSACRQKSTSDLLINLNPAAVLDLGDNQYYCGGYQAFLQSYDLSWGRIKAITHPSVGNHEYLTSGGTGCDINNTGASGYFTYFGSAAGTPGQGYYSFDVGTWHIIALNTNCSSAGGCGSSSPQYAWLQADLAAHTNFCTLAYWHIPLFSSGGRASSNSKPFWQLLYNNNADLILDGHDHIYERFAPQDPNGLLDTARGIREFTVGTGGANHTSITTIAANSELRNVDTFGVLKLTLHSTGYDWQFVPEAGKTFTDSGTTLCHGSTTPATPTPTTVSGPTATSTPLGTLAPTSTPAATPTAPDTSITSGPSGTVKNTSASFSFTSTIANSTYECSLEGAAFSSCTSPISYTGLSDRSHTFQVRSISPTGIVDSTPASRTWSIDTVAPTGVAVTAPADGSTVTGQVKISASASDNTGVVSVSFFVDGKRIARDSSAPYSASWNTGKFQVGTHSLYVTATDAAGNVTQSATITVTVN